MSDGPKQRKKYTWSKEGLSRTSERMRKLNADPEFKEKQSERMRKLNADPEFNPLANLSKEQREDYDVLRKKGGYSRQEALAMVCGLSATISEVAG